MDAYEPGRAPLPAHLSPRRRAARGRRLLRAASWTAVVAGVVVLALGAASVAYYERLDHNVHRVPLVISGPRPAPAVDGAENILVVGDDSRTGETAEQLHEESTTGDGGSENTDTIILLHLAPGGGPATLVSIPRDSYVAIPGHGTNKINAAYPDGEADHAGTGPALLTETVEHLTGVHVDHFVNVSFGQFIALSNAVGGVRVCISTPGGAHEPRSGVDLPQGVSTVKGGEALSFVRQRYDLPHDDFDRIRRQQRFVAAVAAKVATVRNPATLNAVLQTATKSLTVDSGLSGIALARLAERLHALGPADIRFATIPVADGYASTTIGGRRADIDRIDPAAVTAFLATVQADAPAAGPTTAGPTTAGPAAATSQPAVTSAQDLTTGPTLDGVPCGP